MSFHAINNKPYGLKELITLKSRERNGGVLSLVILQEQRCIQNKRRYIVIDNRTAEFHASVMRLLPRNLPAEVEQAWTTDPSGLAAALNVALNPYGLADTPEIPQVQQIVFLVRLNYNEKVIDKAKRIKNWNRGGGSVIYSETLNEHGKKSSALAVGRLVKIPQQFEKGAEVIPFLDSLKLRPGTSVELADCALQGRLERDKIGLSPVIALGDYNPNAHSQGDKDHNHFGYYHHTLPTPAHWGTESGGKVWRTLSAQCDMRFHPNSWWYLAFKN